MLKTELLRELPRELRPLSHNMHFEIEWQKGSDLQL